MARLQISQKSNLTANDRPEIQGGLTLRLLIATLAWLGLWLVLSLPNAPVSLAASEQSNPLCGSTGSVSALFRVAKPGRTYGLACTIPLPSSQANPPSPGPLAMAGPGGSPVQTSLKLSNSGLRGSTLDVTLDSVTPGFNVLGLPVTKLAPGATASLGIGCQPAFSPASGKLVLATTDPAQPLLTYQLSCSSAIPAFTAMPGPGNLLTLSSDSSVEANNIAAHEILVSNEGQPQSQLNLTLNSLSPGFSVQGLPTSVSAGNVAVSLQVTCQPLAALTGFSLSAGVRKGSLVLNTSDPSQPTVSYALTCSAAIQPVAMNNVSNTSTNFNAPAAISTLVAAASVITAPPALAQTIASPDGLAAISNSVAANNASASSEQTLPQATASVPANDNVVTSPVLGSQALGLSGASAGLVASLGNGSTASQSGAVAGQLGHWVNAQSAAANALAGLFAAS